MIFVGDLALDNQRSNPSESTQSHIKSFKGFCRRVRLSEKNRSLISIFYSEKRGFLFFLRQFGEVEPFCEYYVADVDINIKNN